jgi:hypothetical protein
MHRALGARPDSKSALSEVRSLDGVPFQQKKKNNKMTAGIATAYLPGLHSHRLALDDFGNLVTSAPKIYTANGVLDASALVAALTGIPGAAQNGSTSDSTALTSAITQLGTTPSNLVISGPVYLTTNVTIPKNIQLMLIGNGMIKPASGVTVTINGAINAGAWQIFDLSLGGTIAGTVQNSFCYTEWFGADNTGTLDSTSAFNSTCVFAHGANDIAIQLLAGTYKLTSTIILNGNSNGSFTHPNLLGDQRRKTTLSYAGITSGTPCIQMKGGSGTLSGGIVRDIYFLGDSTSIAVEFMGQCGSRVQNCYFDINAVGVRWHNNVAATFTEFCTVEGSEWRGNCVLPMEYKRTSGTNSFHGSGTDVTKNIINSNGGTVVQIDGTGCFVYNAPCYMQVFCTIADTTIFQNSNSVAPVAVAFSGRLTIETSSARNITLGAGAAVYFAGPVQVTGLATGTGANVVGGTLVRVETVSSYADSSIAFTGAKVNQSVVLASGTTQVTSGIRQVRRLVNVNIKATNYTFRALLDVDFTNTGAAMTPVVIRANNLPITPTAAGSGQQLHTYLFDGVAIGAPTFTGNVDGSFNIVSPTTPGFVLNAAGATNDVSATLTTTFSKASGVYNVLFSNGDIRAVTFTNGSAACTWTGGLTSATTTAITVNYFQTTGYVAQVTEVQVSNGLEGGGHILF